MVDLSNGSQHVDVALQLHVGADTVNGELGEELEHHLEHQYAAVHGGETVLVAQIEDHSVVSVEDEHERGDEDGGRFGEHGMEDGGRPDLLQLGQLFGGDWGLVEVELAVPDVSLL